MGIADAGGGYTLITGLPQSQHQSIQSLRHDVTCICHRHTPGALHVEQTAIYECKRLGDGKLCNATSCESISWDPTLVNPRDVLEHRKAAKQHLVHSI